MLDKHRKSELAVTDALKSQLAVISFSCDIEKDRKTVSKIILE